MTRFARAKGSKASNERIPEEATSWSDMKQQLLDKKQEIEDNKQREILNKTRNANYKTFLNEVEEKQAKDVQWAEFPGEKPQEKPSKKARKRAASEDSDAPPEETSISKNAAPEIKVKKLKKKKAKTLEIVLPGEEKKNPENVGEENKPKKVNVTKEVDLSGLDEEAQAIIKRKFEKKKERRLKQVAKKNEKRRELKANANKAPEPKVKKSESELTEIEKAKIEKKQRKSLAQAEKRRKGRAEKQQQKLVNNNLESESNGNNLKPRDNGFKSSEKNNDFKQNGNNFKSKETNNFESSENNSKPPQVKKPGKPRDNKKHDRKKPLSDKPATVVLNDQEIEVGYVDGFPVRKADAERLTQLRKQMISRGLPRSEIDTSLKLERRKAEKAFTRDKRRVCLQCRKPGHDLAECPVNNSSTDLTPSSGGEICFKCGSTEHKQFECKVVRSQDFKFATCFICKESGHISRQCPDNARGLYPQGGGCHVCGDVTHLKRDCPSFQSQQLNIEKNLELGTIDGRNPDEDFGGRSFEGVKVAKKMQKIIKF